MATRRDVAAASTELSRAIERFLQQSDAAGYALSGWEREVVLQAKKVAKRTGSRTR